MVGLDALAEVTARSVSVSFDEDEHAPHVLLVVDPETGVGPAAGPVRGVLEAMTLAERMEAVLNEANDGAPVSVAIVRLFGPPDT